MTIYTHIPYNKDKNLGNSYNAFMELLPNDEDYACFIDHDAMFTTVDWYLQLESIIKNNPDVGCFTCLTNRVGNPEQIYNFDKELLSNIRSLPNANRYKIIRNIVNETMSNHDIFHHRKIGLELQTKFNCEIKDITHSEFLMSGHLILIQKKVWKYIKFSDGFFGVDNNLHISMKNNNLKVVLMLGVYIYHWYRGNVE